MADTSQPTVLDYATSTQWRLALNRLPKTSWFCTAANIPGISLGEAQYPTPMTDMFVSGDKLTFETLSITFLVDEELQNYRELWDWIVGIGFPEQHSEYETVLGSSNRSTTYSLAEDADPRYKATPSDSALYSDATLTIYNSKNLPKINIIIKDMYPTSLSALEYSNADADVDYLSGIVTFNYLHYTFETHK